MLKNNLKIQDSFVLADKILRKTCLQFVKRLETQLHGDYSSIFFGHGLDFKEIREYTEQDDIKNIDWNVTARMNKPYVRTYSQEKELITWLVLDMSESMNFGSDLVTKKDVLVQFSAVIAYLTVKKGNKIGAIIINDSIEKIIPPAKTLKQAYMIIQQILDYKASKSGGIFDLSRLKYILGKKKSIFFVSDFIFPDKSWGKYFGELSLKNALTPVHIVDPVEENIPEIGYINLTDSETGKKILIDTSNKEVMQEYKKLLEDEYLMQEKVFAFSQTNPVKIYTDSNIADVMIEYSKQIKRKGKK